MNSRKNGFYTILKKITKIFYNNWQFQGLSNIPREPSVIVGNHSQIYGPIVAELLFPYPKCTWCTAEVMSTKEFPDYAMRDFFIYKNNKFRWFYRLVSKIIAKPLSYIFNNADALPVYKDSRIIFTFKKSISQLEQNKHLIIFPEKHSKYNQIINEFHTNFIDLARLYYKKTKKNLSFVPMYIAPKLKKVVFGEKIQFNPDVEFNIHKQQINDYIKNTITSLAKELPVHTVIPYLNVSKKEYLKSH